MTSFYISNISFNFTIYFSVKRCWWYWSQECCKNCLMLAKCFENVKCCISPDVLNLTTTFIIVLLCTVFPVIQIRINITVFLKRSFKEGLICYLMWTFCIVFSVENNIYIFFLCHFLRRVVMYYNPQEAVVYQEDCVLGQA